MGHGDVKFTRSPESERAPAGAFQSGSGADRA